MDRYSSTVAMYLQSEKHTLGLSKTGPGYVVLQNPHGVALGQARVLMSVDGKPRIWDVLVTRQEWLTVFVEDVT